MTQRPIVAYLSLKGMSGREIHDDIVDCQPVELWTTPLPWKWRFEVAA
jgi:hypothetical protein